MGAKYVLFTLLTLAGLTQCAHNVFADILPAPKLIGVEVSKMEAPPIQEALYLDVNEDQIIPIASINAKKLPRKHKTELVLDLDTGDRITIKIEATSLGALLKYHDLIVNKLADLQ